MGNIIGSLFKIAEYTLKYKNMKEENKILNRVLYLKKVYYNEENKPELKRSHALMYNSVHELCVIIESITNFKK